MFLEHLLNRNLAESSRIQRMTSIDLLLAFRSLEHHLAGVYHNHVIAHIHKRCPTWTAFAAENRSNLTGEMTDGPPGGIDHKPASISSELLPAGKVC